VLSNYGWGIGLYEYCIVYTHYSKAWEAQYIRVSDSKAKFLFKNINYISILYIIEINHLNYITKKRNN